MAFNFANPPEANEFKVVVNSKIAAKRRKEEKRSKPINQHQNHTINPISHEKIWDTASKQEFQKKKRMRNITKADIGSYLNLQLYSVIKLILFLRDTNRLCTCISRGLES